jgi:uncharacterized membrane protein YkoI
MTTLNVKIHNEQEEKVLLAFLDSLQYEYEVTDEMDTTEYLLSSEATTKHINESMQEAKEGKVTHIAIDDLWK